MAFELVEIGSVSLDDLKTRHPDGYHSTAHGCYYFADMDGDAAYYIQQVDDSFVDDVNYVDFDLLCDAEKSSVLYELQNLG